MDKDQFEGKWHEYKGKIKEKWGKLTDDDFMEIRGKKEALVGKIQARYGYAKEKIERELADLCGCEKNQYGHGHGQGHGEQNQYGHGHGHGEQNQYGHGNCGQKPCGCKGPCHCGNQHGHGHGNCGQKPCGCKGPCNCGNKQCR